jgi:hypothetical protein
MPETAEAPDPAVSRHIPPPPLVVLAGWLIPGAGYWIIGQRARALIVGITIITLFMGGVLLGGVRSLQVPGYGENGGKLYVVGSERESNGKKWTVSEIVEHRPGSREPKGHWVVTEFRTLLAEVGNKPWSICQIWAGPLALGNAAWSVSASRPIEQADGTFADPAGVLSHSRINEIAILYMAVAGMLNLLTMIDAAGRADDLLSASGGKRSSTFHAILVFFRLAGSMAGGSGKK